jgi:hypothetical protein
MLLLVDALKRVGPNLTRARLAQVLDSTQNFTTGLTRPLSWSAANHYSNTAAQAFAVQSKNGFSGFRFIRDYLTDPWIGQDAG